MRDYAFFTHKSYMELEKLALLIADEFVVALTAACDAMLEPEAEDDGFPKVMIAGSR